MNIWVGAVKLHESEKSGEDVASSKKTRESSAGKHNIPSSIVGPPRTLESIEEKHLSFSGRNLLARRFLVWIEITVEYETPILCVLAEDPVERRNLSDLV